MDLGYPADVSNILQKIYPPGGVEIKKIGGGFLYLRRRTSMDTLIGEGGLRSLSFEAWVTILNRCISCAY